MIYFCLLFFFGFCFSVHNELVYFVGQLTVQLILLCEDDERKYNKNRRDNKHHCGNGVLCELCLNGESRIIVGELKSEGYDYFEIDLSELSPVTAERGTTAALVRGVAAGFAMRGFGVGGFDAYVSSDVLPGSGLSSSASFEVLIGTVINDLGEFGLTPVEIARIGQYAENVFFGKPSGLMDQTACAVGGTIAIDFSAPEDPVIRPVCADFGGFGHSLCIIESGADHAGLTDEYAAIPAELSRLCGYFGKKYLREVPEEEFYLGISGARKFAGDRAILRAMHIYDENRRVDAETAALESGRFDEFLRLVNGSGTSSWTLLQNITPAGSTRHQELAVALALCGRLLNGRGACRVHGGGFAGTIQAFVPNDMLEDFKTGIESYLGAGCCHILTIRREGGTRERFTEESPDK